MSITTTMRGGVNSTGIDQAAAITSRHLSTILLVLFSLGGITGPTLASALMTLVGPSGLFLFNALSCVLLALSARYALLRKNAAAAPAAA